MLWWMDAGSLGQTEQEDEKEEWTFMWESSWSALSSVQGWVKGQLKSCRWRLAVQITCSVAVGRVAVELLTRKTVGEAFFRLLEEASHSQALVLMGDFKHSYICCRNNTEGQSWRSWRFSRSHQWQVPTMGDWGPDKEERFAGPITSKEELFMDVKVSDHKMVTFMILQGRSRAKRQTPAQNFRRAAFVLFRGLFGRIPWNASLERSPGELDWFSSSGKVHPDK